MHTHKFLKVFFYFFNDIQIVFKHYGIHCIYSELIDNKNYFHVGVHQKLKIIFMLENITNIY